MDTIRNRPRVGDDCGFLLLEYDSNCLFSSFTFSLFVFVLCHSVSESFLSVRDYHYYKDFSFSKFRQYQTADVRLRLYHYYYDYSNSRLFAPRPRGASIYNQSEKMEDQDADDFAR